MRGYADSTSDVRSRKARKIQVLLGELGGQDLLDLGAGSGLLSGYFSEGGANVTAADRDRHAYSAEAPFVLIDDPPFPFDADSFDIVVFNHVIEHVGGRPAQELMISEIARVMRPGGRLYIAAPNRWSLIEPHFRLPLLSAVPRPIADAMVRLSGKGLEYDCFPLGYFELRAILGQCFGDIADRTTDALTLLIEHEMTSAVRRVARLMPTALVKPAHAVLPTFVFICSKPIKRERH